MALVNPVRRQNLEGFDDAHIVALAQAGNEAAFREIMRRNSRGLFRVARTVVCDASTKTAERIALVASSRVPTRSSGGPCGSQACCEPSWNTSIPGRGRRARFLRCAERFGALVTKPRCCSTLWVHV